MTTAGWLRARDPRASILALLIVLAGITTTPGVDPWVFAAWTLLLLTAAVAAHMSLEMCRRTLIVLPFAAILGLGVVPVGGWIAAAALIAKAWLSAFAVLVVTESVSAPRMFHALSRLGCPQPLALVLQFVYRYVFLLAESARKMRTAAYARGMDRAPRRRAFRAAAGLVAVLFISAHARAVRINAAMTARGFNGYMPVLTRDRLRFGDAALVVAALALVLSIRSR